MQLTNLQYGVLIQALHNAQELHLDGEFIDPYAENAEGYTDEDITKAIDEVESIVRQSWESVELINNFDYDNSTEEELLAHVAKLEAKGVMSLKFNRGGLFYDIDEHSEGGFYYSVYKSIGAYNRGEDDIDGGLCTSTLTNAVEMALN